MGYIRTWPCTLIRWLIFGPAVFYISISVQYTSRVLDQPVLHNPPYSPRIRYGALLSNISSILIVTWNSLMVVFMHGSDASAVLLQGIIDLAVATVLSASVVLQSSYVPHTVGACKRIAETYQVPQNTSSLFRLASHANANATTVVTTCGDFQTIWYIAISILGLAFLSAILNIWLSGWWKHDSGVTLLSLNKALISGIKFGSLCCYQILLIFSLLPWQLLKRILLICRPPGRFARRYFWKWKSRSHHQKLIEKSLERELLDPRFYVSQTSRASTNDTSEKKTVQVTYRNLSIENILADFPYDITVLFCRYLHGGDIYNLGLTSKKIRHGLFGHDNMTNRLSPRFKAYSCSGEEKKPCWSCGMQVCKRCSFSATCEGTPAAKHLRRCKPACSKCYFKSTRKNFETRPFSETTCDVQHCTSGGWTYSSAPERSRPRTVCQNCSNANPTELTNMRNERDKVTIEKLGQQEPETCYMCQKALRVTGPRWWFCSVCHKECTNDFHPQWIGKKKVVMEKC